MTSARPWFLCSCGGQLRLTAPVSFTVAAHLDNPSTPAVTVGGVDSGSTLELDCDACGSWHYFGPQYTARLLAAVQAVVLP
ncbi:hypothetical protein ACIQF6_19585 [Kitasatospora sp. NPDC092948]|uniref:hypothetical protein n=1 Tax=Kitasatospora sp. NPDC092948 TaxID=3364088 RepID=UPI003811227B